MFKSTFFSKLVGLTILFILSNFVFAVNDDDLLRQIYSDMQEINSQTKAITARMGSSSGYGESFTRNAHSYDDRFAKFNSGLSSGNSEQLYNEYGKTLDSQISNKFPNIQKVSGDSNFGSSVGFNPDRESSIQRSNQALYGVSQDEYKQESNMITNRFSNQVVLRERVREINQDKTLISRANGNGNIGNQEIRNRIKYDFVRAGDSDFARNVSVTNVYRDESSAVSFGKFMSAAGQILSTGVSIFSGGNPTVNSGIKLLFGNRSGPISNLAVSTSAIGIEKK